MPRNAFKIRLFGAGIWQNYLILTAENLKSYRCKLVHVRPLKLQRRMNISVKGDLYRRVSEDLAQRLDLKSHFYTPGCKCVPEGVEMHPLKAAGCSVFFKTILQSARFHWFSCSCKQKCISVILGKGEAQRIYLIGHRNYADRLITFRRGDNQAGFAVTLAGRICKLRSSCPSAWQSICRTCIDPYYLKDDL